MRMWMVEPAHMCRQHLLGEHVELHMFLGSMRRGVRMDGFIDNNLLEPKSLFARHESLVAEMARRNYNHSSPMDEDVVTDEILKLPYSMRWHDMDYTAARIELFNRCEMCQARRAANNKAVTPTA